MELSSSLASREQKHIKCRYDRIPPHFATVGIQYVYRDGKVTANMIFNGSFKFRANQAWQLDFGTDSNGNLAYANHPWKEYVVREELTVPADGSYTIILDLSHPGEYSYSIN